MCPNELPSLDACRKHPHLNLWGHEGYAFFLNAQGQQLAHLYPPQMRVKTKNRGYHAPVLGKNYSPRMCHIIMGEIFYGERKIFKDSKGKPYFGHCHHLINDPLDYRPENLLCWLDYSEHRKADNRRRALEALVPDGDLHAFTYERLRYLQDPRSLSDEDFQKELALIRDSLKHHPLIKVNPLDAAAEERNKYSDPFIERD